MYVFVHTERGVRQHLRQVAVVGEQQQAGGVRVQAADVEQPLLVPLRVLREVGAAAVVVHRRDHAGRLVQHHVRRARVDPDRHAVDGDLVDRRDRPGVPGSVTMRPFTATRPAAIRSSETRREATPAAASTFCSRSPSARAAQRASACAPSRPRAAAPAAAAPRASGSERDAAGRRSCRRAPRPSPPTGDLGDQPAGDAASSAPSRPRRRGSQRSAPRLTGWR